MREVVRKKLGLSQDATIHLAQTRSGKTIDLEDGVWPGTQAKFAIDATVL